MADPFLAAIDAEIARRQQAPNTGRITMIPVGDLTEEQKRAPLVMPQPTPQADPLLSAIDAEIAKRQQIETLTRQKDILGERMNHPYIAAAKDVGNAVLQGATGNFADEAVGLISPEQQAYMRERQNLFAGLPGEQTLGGKAAQFGAEAIGSILPVAAVGRGVKAAQAGGSLLSNALKAVAGGAVGGGVYGAGAGEDASERVIGGTVGALAGGTLGGAVPVVGAGVKAAANSEAARIAANLLKESEGALMPKRIRDVMLNRGEKGLLSEFAHMGVKPDDIAKGVQALEKSRAAGSKASNFVDSLADDELGVADSVRGYVQYLRNDPASRGEVASAILPRRNEAQKRIIEILEPIAPDAKEPVAAMQKLVDAANAKIKNSEASRKRVSSIYYKQAYETPIAESEQVTNILGRKRVREAIDEVRANFEDEVKDLPDNHLAVLDRAKRVLDQKAANYLSKLNGSQNKELASRYVAEADMLRSAIDEVNPAYKTARKVFEEMSKELSELRGSKLGSKRSHGVLEGLIKHSENNNIMGVGNYVFKLQPTEIKKLMRKLGPKGDENIRGAVRAHLQTLMEKSNDKGQSALFKFWNGRKENSLNRERLLALVGEDEFNRLAPLLDAEVRIHDTNVAAGLNSQTNPFKQRDERGGEIIEAALSAASPGGAVREGIKMVKAGAKMPDEVKREIARLLLNPEASLETMPKVSRVMAQKDVQNALAEALGLYTNKAGKRVGSVAAGKAGSTIGD